jgi:hypothetical protein
MEFPPETYDVFEADQFETARARLTGDAVMEAMLQMRPNGRCLDHYHIALDGTVLETWDSGGPNIEADLRRVSVLLPKS